MTLQSQWHAREKARRLAGHLVQNKGFYTSQLAEIFRAVQSSLSLVLSPPQIPHPIGSGCKLV